MRASISVLLAVLMALGASAIQADTVDEYVRKAEEHKNADRIDEAVRVMEEAVKEYPDSSTVNSYLGLYVGMKAGRIPDFMVAGQLAQKAFGLVDRAVSLDPGNPIARFNRGILYVNTPKFLGKMKTGIQDLEFLMETSDKVSKDILIGTYEQLARAYAKEEQEEKARLVWEKVIELAPGTELAKKAEISIAKLSEEKQPQLETQPDSAVIASLKQKVEKNPDSPELLLELGEAHVDASNFQEAEKVLKEAVRIDPDNLEAYKMLASVLEDLVGEGYDERIYKDTDLRTNLAFEIMSVLDKTVKLAPADAELRLLRGMLGVQFPFFVGKLDQAMDDLNQLIEADVPDSVKADALYWLGKGYQKKAMTEWIKVVSDYPNSQASRSVFETMRPAMKRLDISEYQFPILTIDFVLGFRDELPPQTVVWVEDKGGQFVKTIYVSGFSGYAKEQQINLPEWSDSSEFADTDGVTGASIDVGHHIYVWDLKDNSGKQVKPGKYVVKVEVHYWPSMEYQLSSVVIKLGEKETRSITNEGNFIPYLEAIYHPAKAK